MRLLITFLICASCHAVPIGFMIPTIPGAVGWWTLNEGSGTIANDYSGIGNSGGLTNTPVWTNGQFGKCLQFTTASSQYVGFTNNPKPAATTVMAWVKRSSTGTRHQIFDAEDVISSKLGGFDLAILATDMVTLSVGKNTGTSVGVDYKIANSNTLITNLNTWYHIAATADGATLKMYINGILETNVVWANPIAYTTSRQMNIGRLWETGAAFYYFNGLIDDVWIGNRALNQQEIQFRMNDAQH